jgi:hypothetical protein
MLELSWHSGLQTVSCLAALVGLVWSISSDRVQDSDQRRDNEETLLRMAFTYWIVFCLSVALQKLDLPPWDGLIVGLKFTAMLTYCLTFSSIVCLPLHHFESRRQTQ